MRFSRQPNGRWCGYSTISDSFYHVHLTDKELVAAVIADIAKLDFACDKIPDPTNSEDLLKYCQTICGRSVERINKLFHDGGYDFDQIIDHFRYDNDKRETRDFWVRQFKYMGCDKEQMERVNAGIDWLEENNDLIIRRRVGHVLRSRHRNDISMRPCCMRCREVRERPDD